MSCKHAEDVCQHCLEKVQTTTEASFPKFCQHCLEKKVQTRKEVSPPKHTMPLGTKIILLPVFSSFLAACGYLWVKTSKVFFKTAKDTWKLICTPTE